MEALNVLKEKGTTLSIIDKILPWGERQRLVDLPTIKQLEKKYSIE
jgi:hypothetical protein